MSEDLTSASWFVVFVNLLTSVLLSAAATLRVLPLSPRSPPVVCCAVVAGIETSASGTPRRLRTMLPSRSRSRRRRKRQPHLWHPRFFLCLDYICFLLIDLVDRFLTGKRPLATLHGSGGAVRALAWADRGFFLSAGADHCVRVWDAQAGRNTHTLVRKPPSAADSRPAPRSRVRCPTRLSQSSPLAPMLTAVPECLTCGLATTASLLLFLLLIVVLPRAFAGRLTTHIWYFEHFAVFLFLRLP